MNTLTPLLEVVQTIESLDKAREAAVEDVSLAQKDLEETFAQYLYCVFNGLAPIAQIYAEAIKKHNEGIRVFLDFQVETIEKSSTLLKDLVIRKASDEEYIKGLKEVEGYMQELQKRAQEYLE